MLGILPVLLALLAPGLPARADGTWTIDDNNAPNSIIDFNTVPVAPGAPDEPPLHYCREFWQELRPDQRHAVRRAVRALESLDSHIGQLQLGRELPSASPNATAPDAAVLESWRDGNATRLTTVLLESDAARLFSGSAAAAVAVSRACGSSRLTHDAGLAATARPLVSVLLEYFKRPAVVSLIARTLLSSCASVGVSCELVVNVDNPHEASAWAAEVAAGSVVPVFSSNVHESRGYNRAARAARGRYLVVWQDDQIPPNSGRWLVDMLALFSARPDLGILGLNKYRLCRQRESNNRWGPTPWEPDPLTAEVAGGGGSTRGGVRWSFAMLVDFAPMAVRARLWREVGGLEEGWTRRGDCGIAGDWELCARAWVAGWQVGYMHIDGRVDDASAPGGTHTPTSAEACWGRQGHIGRECLRVRYANDGFFTDLCERVWLLNSLAFTLARPELCPYNTTTTKFGNCSAPDAGALRAAAALMQGPELRPLPGLRR
ncbi:hypothetical protein GPECTOR_5g67 [Gonium pectorale]|uniref:Glycosyltransferase 2-like domain-containing protein n=1 Tax=Gonium pectorale TaxID=33097 RepID=A0A150GXJ5_GONPE|nr:hypothetical protein GPECTOR_5g67 [Gonium pectorale]|eukprot:KXZ54412.1 hypothetical protein GPECTOR_5g67 [Gonium pectorale]